MFRTRSPRFVDLVINHPSVRPTAGEGTERLSSADLVNDYRNIFLADEGGMVVFLYLEPGVYDAHIFVIDSHRGASAVALGKAALAALFSVYEARKCVATVRAHLRKVRYFARRVGFTGLGVDPSDNVEHFVMEIV